jgi:hypothetical protein
MLRTCPAPAAIADIVPEGCQIDFDQIIMLIFQRVQSAAPFTATSILLLATWTPLLTAADSTKVVATPKFAELVIPQSTAIQVGGNDNTTINGIPQYNGEGFVPVTAEIPGLDSLTKRALKNLTPESIPNALGQSGLSVYMVNRFSQIIAMGKDATHIYGFPVNNFRVSSVGSQGFNARNKTQIGFDLLPDWDDYAQVYTPTAFDPLVDIHQ